MPYIKELDRADFDPAIEELIDQLNIQDNDPGHLNYVVSRLAGNHVKAHGLSYKTLNEVVGVLESIKAEFYARVVRPYERFKRTMNGDVPEYEEVLTEEL